MKKVLAAVLVLCAALIMAGCENTNDRGVIIDHGAWPFSATTPNNAPLPAVEGAPATTPAPASV